MINNNAISAYYEHPTDAIDAARKELQNEIAIRLLNATGSPVRLLVVFLFRVMWDTTVIWSGNHHVINCSGTPVREHGSGYLDYVI